MTLASDVEGLRLVLATTIAAATTSRSPTTAARSGCGDGHEERPAPARDGPLRAGLQVVAADHGLRGEKDKGSPVGGQKGSRAVWAAAKAVMVMVPLKVQMGAKVSPSGS